MVGKKQTLKKVRGAIRAAGATALKTTTFVQGKTHRWGIGWTFSKSIDVTLFAEKVDTDNDDIAAKHKRKRPKVEKSANANAVGMYAFLLDSPMGAQRTLKLACTILEGSGCQVQMDPNLQCITFSANTDNSNATPSSGRISAFQQDSKQKTLVFRCQLPANENREAWLQKLNQMENELWNHIC